jgi:hypothetical protein
MQLLEAVSYFVENHCLGTGYRATNKESLFSNSAQPVAQYRTMLLFDLLAEEVLYRVAQKSLDSWLKQD